MDEKLGEEYFKWICRLIGGRRKRSHQMLLMYLRDKPFTYILEMDGNRESDGIQLRYRFGTERGIDSRIVARSLDDKPCSVLEMMAALAFQCQEHILNDPDAGSKAPKLFWGMIDNLGLGFMTDKEFDFQKTEAIINRLLNRKYKSNGRGGLFALRECRYDLRTMEIWYQAMWYITENMAGERGG